MTDATSCSVCLCPCLCLFPPCRHDYCGVQEDLRNWWPKLRRGGILAGHDYLTANSPVVVESKQDWSCEALCLTGTRAG